MQVIWSLLARECFLHSRTFFVNVHFTELFRIPWLFWFYFYCRDENRNKQRYTKEKNYQNK